MSTSNNDHGEQALKASLNEQRNTSLLEVFGGEQWLLSNGIVSETAVDTLLGYAYMQNGVRHVRLGVDLDQKNDGKNPKVIYQVRLGFWLGIKYRLVKHYASKPGVFNKLLALFTIKLGAPPSGSIEAQITRIAQGFLPAHYTVQVEIN